MRFPHSDRIADDHPLSRIPREHDLDVIESLDNMGVCDIEYDTTNRTISAHFICFFVREEGGTLYELFSGEWLAKPDSTTQMYEYNLAFLKSLGWQIKYRVYDDKYLGNLDYMPFSRMMAYGDSDADDIDYLASHDRYRIYLQDAKTIGDLRRIYEMLPQGNWYLPPIGWDEQQPIPYQPPDSSYLPVGHESALRAAVEQATNGDTIVLLNDIWVHSPLEIENKKISLVGIDGHQPTLRHLEADYHWSSSINNGIFKLRSASLDIRNLRIIGNHVNVGFDLNEKSHLTLGENVLFESSIHTAILANRSSPLIDGAVIRNSGAFLVFYNSKMTMKRGEISHNNADYYSIIDVSHHSEFVMDGGSIHHNGYLGDPPMAAVGCNGGIITLNGGEIYGNFGRSAGGVYLKQGRVNMNGGRIYDNLSGMSQNGGNNVMVFSYGKVSHFTMNGGSISQSADILRQTRAPSIRVTVNYSVFNYRGGELDLNDILVDNKGRFENRTRK